MFRLLSSFVFAASLLMSGSAVLAQQNNRTSGQWHSTYECKIGSKQVQFRLDLVVPRSDERIIFLKHYQSENGNWSLFRDVILFAQEPLGSTPQNLERIASTRNFRARSFSYNPDRDVIVTDFDNCKGVTLQRVNLDSPAPILGDWEVAFDGCTAGRSLVSLTGRANIELISDGSFAADIEFSENTEEQGNGWGFYLGAFDPASDTLRLNETATTRTLRNGSNRTARSSPNDLELRFNADDGTFSGLSRNCREATFFRPGEKPAVMAATEVLAGEWEGIAACGKQYPVLLTLQEPAGTRINGEISYFPENAVNGGAFTQKLVGEYDTQTQQARLVIAEQPRLIGGPRSFAPGEFVLTSGSEAGSWTASYAGGSCSAMSLSAVTKDSLSRRPTATASDGGAYFSARDTRARCEAASAWLARFEVEYPKIANANTSTDQLYPRMALLFADDDFVPIFGQPFDVIEHDQRLKAANDINNQCARDPLFRTGLELFSTVSRALRQDPNRPLTSFGIPAVFHSIRDTRVLRHEYAGAVAEISNETPLDHAAAKLKPILSTLQSRPDIVWPSEDSDMTGEIAGILGNLAWRDAEIEFETLSKLTEVSKQLPAMTTAAKGGTPYHEFLSENQISALRSTYVLAQNEVIAPILKPDMSEINELPDKLGSFPRLDDLEASAEATLALVLAEVAEPYQTAIEAKRSAIFENLVSASWAKFEAQPTTKNGLAQGAVWLNKFERDFAEFSGRPLYRATLDRFSSRRNQMLAEVVLEFEREALATKGNGQTEMLPEIMASFLSSKIDRGLPASLEYDIVLRSLQ